MAKISWSIDSSTDRDYIIARAVELGWLETPQKVQIRKWDGMETWYIIEPFEEDCNCRNLIKPPKEFKNDNR